MAEKESNSETSFLTSISNLFADGLKVLAHLSGSILDAIKGFFDFLFNTSSGRETGDGNARELELPGGGQTLFNNIQTSVSSARAWANYQQENTGRKVVHKSPLEGTATVGDDRHMREDHPIMHTPQMHHGVDFPASKSSSGNVLASAEGIVIYSGTLRGYGNTVIIGHADGSYSLYAHLADRQMPATQQFVQQGQQIGVMGQSGGATGVHLHYEQRKGSESLVPLIEGKPLTRGVVISQLAVPDLGRTGVTMNGSTNGTPFASAAVKAAAIKR